MTELICEEKNGILVCEAGDRQFSVTPHPGRDALRTRRQVKKLVMPQVAEVSEIRQRAYSKLTKEQKAEYDELAEQLQALEGEESEVKKGIEKKLDDLLSEHEDPGAIAKASANISALLDLDQEELLDQLAFKHAKGRVGSGEWGRLNDPMVFDAVFASKYVALSEKLRDKIIEFNGFLGQ